MGRRGFHTMVVTGMLLVFALAALGPAADAKRVRGTNGPDNLKGTKKKDRMTGKGGDDRLTGRKGKDKLRGGAGTTR